MENYLVSHVRDGNRGVVFKLFLSGLGLSRAEISRKTGISKPTVIKIIDYLLESNLILDMGEHGNAVGRKPTLYKLNKNAAYAVGVVMEGEYVRASLVNLVGEMQPTTLRRVGANFQYNFSVVIPEMIDDLLNASNVERKKIHGICVGIPGAYNPENHIVNYAPLVNITEPTCIRELEETLSRRYTLPVMVQNDVNLAVIGEYRTRGLVQSDLIYVSLGTGVGAAMILDGRLRFGTTWQCGEIGYTVFLRDGSTLAAGTDFLENRINLPELRRRFNLDPYSIAEDQRMEVIAYVSQLLSVAICNIVTLLDCDTIVLGGVLTQCLGSRFVQQVAAQVKNLSAIGPSVEEQQAIDPGILGAACTVLDDAIDKILSERA